MQLLSLCWGVARQDTCMTADYGCGVQGGASCVRALSAYRHRQQHCTRMTNHPVLRTVIL